MYAIAFTATLAALAGTTLAAPGGWQDSGAPSGGPWAGRPRPNCGAPGPSAPTSTSKPSPTGTPKPASIDVTFFSDASCATAIDGLLEVDVLPADQCRDVKGSATIGSLKISRIDSALTGVADAGPQSTWGLHIGAEKAGQDCAFDQSIYVELSEKDLVNSCYEVKIDAGAGKTVGGKEYRIEAFVPAK